MAVSRFADEISFREDNAFRKREYFYDLTLNLPINGQINIIILVGYTVTKA